MLNAWKKNFFLHKIFQFMHQHNFVVFFNATTIMLAIIVVEYGLLRKLWECSYSVVGLLYQLALQSRVVIIHCLKTLSSCNHWINIYIIHHIKIFIHTAWTKTHKTFYNCLTKPKQNQIRFRQSIYVWRSMNISISIMEKGI